MQTIKVKSTAISRFGRSPDDLAAITGAAAAGILDDADLDRIAHVFIASYAPGPLSSLSDPFRALTRAIQGRYPRLRATYHGVFKTGGEALYQALEAMTATADAGDVLVIGAEKMTHLDPAEAAGILGRRENEHDGAYGATLPALGGLVTRAYLDRYQVPEAALHAVAVKNHANGTLNPVAHFQKPVTADAVAQSPLVADPLRRLDCAPVSDGAAAALLSRDDGPIVLSGWGRGLDVRLFQDREDISRFAATAEAARAAFTMAGVDAKRIDVVEVHDAFTSFELINLEDMGFFVHGAAWRAALDGELEIGGDLTVNASGGMKARGHPIGATALSGLAEVFLQLTDSAGSRQHAGAAKAAVQSVGGVSRESYVFATEAA